MRSALRGEGAIVDKIPYPRCLALSMVGGTCASVFPGDCVDPVRSALIVSQRKPPSTVFIRYCVPRKRAFGSGGGEQSAGLQGARYLRWLISDSNTDTGHGVMSWLKPVRRLKRPTVP